MSQPPLRDLLAHGRANHEGINNHRANKETGNNRARARGKGVGVMK
jgi:hypothetical protein